MPSINETIALAARLVNAGQPERAAEELRRQVRLHPDNTELHHELGIVCLQCGQGDQAVFHLKRATSISPNRADLHANLATALNIKGRPGEAAESYRRAVSLDPRSFPAHLGLSSALVGIHDYQNAANAARAAADLAPTRPEPIVNLAMALSRLGRSGEAVAELRDSLSRQGDHPLLLTILGAMLITRPGETPEAILDIHERLGRVLQSFAPAFTPLMPDTAPGRRLRLAYISSDMKDAGLARFVEPLLKAHDRNRFEVYLYSSASSPDAATQSLSRLADHFKDVGHLGDAALAETIRRDRIDVLVDLSGQNPGSRLSMMAHRPAPVQISYLGYPATTGLRAIRYRITDSRLDPEGSDTRYVESLVRIEAPCFCVALDGGPAKPAPAKGPSDPIVFCSTSPAHRINESVIETWAAILKAVPDSRLHFKAAAFSAEPARASFRDLFSAQGIDAARLSFAGFDAARADHLAAVAKSDVVLDTFPAAGLGSTCDALSVGVPVMTLAGQTQAGRLGLDLLTAVGREELIARSTDDYIRLATDLARDRARLAKYRSSLAQEFASSPLCDGRSLAGRLEAEYQRLWEEFTAGLYYAGAGLQPDIPPAAVAEPVQPPNPEELPTISASDLV